MTFWKRMHSNAYFFFFLQCVFLISPFKLSHGFIPSRGRLDTLNIFIWKYENQISYSQNLKNEPLMRLWILNSLSVRVIEKKLLKFWLKFDSTYFQSSLKFNDVDKKCWKWRFKISFYYILDVIFGRECYSHERESLFFFDFAFLAS